MTEAMRDRVADAVVDRMREAHLALALDGSLPVHVAVRDMTPEGHATREYAVIVDYGWASTILASGMYAHGARGVALSVAAMCACDVTLDP